MHRVRSLVRAAWQSGVRDAVLVLVLAEFFHAREGLDPSFSGPFLTLLALIFLLLCLLRVVESVLGEAAYSAVHLFLVVVAFAETIVGGEPPAGILISIALSFVLAAAAAYTGKRLLTGHRSRVLNPISVGLALAVVALAILYVMPLYENAALAHH